MCQAASQQSSALPPRQILALQRNTSPWLESRNLPKRELEHLEGGPYTQVEEIIGC